MLRYYILSIETSCDDTSVAILKFEAGYDDNLKKSKQNQDPRTAEGKNLKKNLQKSSLGINELNLNQDFKSKLISVKKGEVLSNIVSSQCHNKFGGVFPEFAARDHNKNITLVVDQCLKEAGITLNQIDFFSATSGPGLIGSVLLGMTSAKTLAIINRKPFIPINHLEGHILSPKINEKVEYPFVVTLVSGGHSQIVSVNDFKDYKILCRTVDDAAGETFDKTARLLDLPYPGGAYIEKMAHKSDQKDHLKFTRPVFNKSDDAMSFSGLKTTVRNYIQKNYKKKFKHEEGKIAPGQDLKIKKVYFDIPEEDKYKISYCLQKAISDILIKKTQHSLDRCKRKIKYITISGGVSANTFIFNEMQKSFPGYIVKRPEMQYCTDNGGMIAWATYEEIRNNPEVYFKINKHKGLTLQIIENNYKIQPKSRWSVEDLALL